MSNFLKNGDDSFMTEENGDLIVGVGRRLERTVDEAVSMARGAEAFSGDNSPISFTFNGVRITVRGDSNTTLLCRDYDRALNGCTGKDVGPYPKPELSAEEKAHDAEVHKKNEEKARRAREKYKAKQEKQRLEFEAKLVDAGPIELSDPEGWLKTIGANNDFYGGAGMRFAERWARLMQYYLAHNNPLTTMAEKAAHGAGFEGITGFQFACAKSILIQTWKHGEELRRAYEIVNAAKKV